MTHSTPLVFFGSDDFSLPVLRALVGAGYDIALVVTKQPHPTSRTLSDGAPIYSWAKAHHLKLITPDRFDEAALAALAQPRAKYAVLASYGKILPDAVLQHFATIINVHPSLLPRWRGPSPIEAAILAGDRQTGVSLIQLVSAMDAGPVYAQSTVDLSGQETQGSLTGQLASQGADFLIEQLPPILTGKLAPAPQDDQSATYCHLINKADGQLDWRLPAVDLERQIRAYAHWPKSRTKLFDTEVIIIQARPGLQSGPAGQTFSDQGELSVYANPGALIIERLQPAGRKPMSGQEFLRGYAR